MSGPGQQVSLAPALYLVATPIGTARDITLRALDILSSADVLVAEDTRTLRRLMELHGVALGGRPLWSYHDHSGAETRARIAERIGQGQAVAYASDAGTPLIADPGFALARDMRRADLAVTAAPGASAVLSALSLAGLPTDRFLFAGFLPPTESARRTALIELAETPATLVFYETAKRIQKMLATCLEVLGDRDAALCRELTKRFEDVRRGNVSSLLAGCDTDPPRGEIVVVIDRSRAVADPGQVEEALKDALKTMRVKDAAKFVSDTLGVARRDVYQLALSLKDE